MKPRPKHPLQPLEKDPYGVVRFKINTIVRHLCTVYGMNELARLEFPREDWEQFAQLLGYSVSGWGDLSYVSKERRAEADALAAQLV